MTSCPAACGIRWVNPSIATVSPSWMASSIARASDTMSATSLPLSRRLYRNDIQGWPRSAHLCGLRSFRVFGRVFGEDLLGDGEGPVGSGHTCVNSHLEQDLTDLLGGQAVSQG